jgi:hypothetical protein
MAHMSREDEGRIRHREQSEANAGDAAIEAGDGRDAVAHGAAADANAGAIAGERGLNGDGTSADSVKQPWDRLEHALAEQLTGGPLEDDPDRERKLRDRISPRYEIRIQTELDPIVEETKQYRKLAKEIDDRYDRFDS